MLISEAGEGPLLMYAHTDYNGQDTYFWLGQPWPRLLAGQEQQSRPVSSRVFVGGSGYRPKLQPAVRCRSKMRE